MNAGSSDASRLMTIWGIGAIENNNGWGRSMDPPHHFFNSRKIYCNKKRLTSLLRSHLVAKS